MTPRNPQFQTSIAAMFHDAPFINLIGARLVECGPGWAQVAVDLRPDLLQHTGVAHAGVVATLADHAAGAAASTLLAVDEYVLTAEFKINLLRPGKGEVLTCRADVLKAGRSLFVVESSVSATDAGNAKLVAKLTATLAVLAR
jgi:uncharacterized protein (TIGR00369 family)